MQGIFRVLGVLIYLFSCQGGGLEGDEEILVRINKEVITLAEFEKRISEIPERYRSLVSGQEGRERFLDQWIKNRLIVQIAKEEGYLDRPEIIEKVKALEDQLLVEAYIKEKILDKVSVSDSETKEYYEKNKQEYISPKEIKVRHILFSVPADATEEESTTIRKKAESVLMEVKKGANFSELAKRYSACPSAKKGGVLEYFSRGQMVREFEDACFKLKKGELSNVVETPFGFHIIEMLDERRGSGRSFEEVQEEIRQRLLAEKQERRFNALISSLEAKAKIEKNLSLLRSKSEGTIEKGVKD
jgi:parvulin-like peptidyl-prolyl isomerase